MSAPENPDAFPRDDRLNGVPGMTLRDYFAGQALAGEIMPPYEDLDEIELREGCESHARAAYAIADAMLAERLK